MSIVKVRLTEDRQALLDYFQNHPARKIFAALAGTVRIAEETTNGCFECKFVASRGLLGPIEGIFIIPSHLVKVIPLPSHS